MDDILFQLKQLPCEIISIIQSYIPYDKQVLLNKSTYNKYHYKIFPNVLKINVETYIRKIIISDYDFIFNVLINDNLYKWINIKKYRYQQMIFKNYIHFLRYFANENNAIKCSNYINHVIAITGLDGKQHKNKINRNVIWIK